MSWWCGRRRPRSSAGSGRKSAGWHTAASSAGAPWSTPGDLGVLVLPWDFAVEFWDGAMSDKRRRPLCDGVRLNGLPCRVARLPGSRFCFSHDPTTAREREAAQALGPANGDAYLGLAAGEAGVLGRDTAPSSIVRDVSPSTS